MQYSLAKKLVAALNGRDRPRYYWLEDVKNKDALLPSRKRWRYEFTAVAKRFDTIITKSTDVDPHDYAVVVRPNNPSGTFPASAMAYIQTVLRHFEAAGHRWFSQQVAWERWLPPLPQSPAYRVVIEFW